MPVKEAPSTSEIEAKGEENKSTSQVEATKEQKKGTTALLFPEELKSVEPEKKEETKEKKKQEEPAPEYLDVEAFGTKLIKVKIDGVEKEVSFKDVIKGYQVDSYLTQKGQKISETEKQVKEILKGIQEKQPEKPKEEAKTEEPLSPEEKWVADILEKQLQKRLKPLEDENKELKRTVVTLESETKDIRYERAIQSIDKRIKTELKQTDFIEYLPKIVTFITSLPPDQIKLMDNEAGILSVYKELKLIDLTSKVGKTKEEEKEVKEKKIVKVESGNNPSTGDSVNDDADGKSLFKEAKKTGNWTDYLKWKRAL